MAMKAGLKRFLNSLKGPYNKIKFLERIIADQNKHINYLENRIKNCVCKEESWNKEQ